MNKEFFGDKVRLARLMNGLTQQELGDLVLVSRQFIHQLESGVKQPADDTLFAIAEVLRVNTRFFYIPLANDVKPEQCHFRKRKTTPVNLSNRVLALGTIFEQLVFILDKNLELPHIDFPDINIPNELTAEDIERSAEECRKYWGLGNNAPISNMIRVLENAGAVITCFDGVSDKVDALSINRNRPIIVRNNAKESICRMRFDLAHETAHIVLHQGVETGCSKTESEANAFASAFLFPRSAFLREFQGCIGKIRINWDKVYALKLRWKMSVRAIMYRAYYLGLLTAQQFRSANVYLNKSGQTKTEYFDEKIPDEHPEILSAALDILNQDMNISIYGIAEKLGISEEIIAQLTGYDLSKQVKHNNVRSLSLAR
ncbi:helix-turn-helix domain-containing protein [Thiothrix caldifontis]|nr:XRE family transcriptional regulator [Thiothrix caldifontis]